MNAVVRRNWWDRNWKWFVPVLCVLSIALLATLILGICALAFGLIRSSEPYQQALQRAQSSPLVAAALGPPIKPGLLMTGNISTGGGDGKAQLAIPLEGSRHDATLYVRGEETAGVWHYSIMAVAVENGKQRIDLLNTMGGN
ncbi:MAG: cytochrome c oxidase assembly factor Coa1 family protein [Rhodanobacteraceae bacterium]